LNIMAYKENSISFSVGGYNSYKTSTVDYTNHYAKATFSASTSGSTLSWSITMSTSTPSGAPKVSIYLSIDGKQQIDVGPAGTSNNYSDNYSGFPCKNGSTLSGTVDIGTKTSIPIILTVGPATNNADYWFVNSTDGTSKTTRHGATKYLTRVSYTNMSAGTVTIRDNYNNSYTVTGTRGSTPAGDSNTVTGHKLCCGTSSASDWDYVYETTNLSKTVSFTPLGTSDYRKVKGKIITYGTYHSSDPSYSSKDDVRQYIAPSAPGAPVISYNKSKLTIKEPWVYTWPDNAEDLKANNTSPVVGYRIHLYRIRDGVEEALIIKDTDGKALSTWDAKYNKYVYDRDSASTSITIYPEVQEFLPGDKVKLGIHSYTRFGQENNMEGSKNALFNTGQVYSIESEVQKAGLLKVNTPDGWKEGQAFIMTENGWKEASSVFIKSEKGWKEPK
jgi:hypothetical protein